MRSGPRAWARRARPRRGGRPEARGCRSGRRRRSARRCSPSRPGRRRPEEVRKDAARRAPIRAAPGRGETERCACRAPRRAARVRASVAALETPKVRRCEPAGDEQLGRRVAGDGPERGEARRARPPTRRARARGTPGTAPSSSSRSSGESTSTARSRRARRSRTSTPATSASQRGSALSPARSGGRSAERRRRARDGDRVGRVVVVRERRRGVAGGGLDERPQVRVRRERDRPRPEDDEAGRARARATSRASRAPNGVSSAGSRRTMAVVRPGGQERRAGGARRAPSGRRRARARAARPAGPARARE